jgi:hypothetical protein
MDTKMMRYGVSYHSSKNINPPFALFVALSDATEFADSATRNEAVKFDVFDTNTNTVIHTTTN